MEIFLAKHMGMCMGLRLIMHRTKREIKASQNRDVYIFRELVHNQQAHSELIQMGAKAQMFHVEDIPHNSTVIVGPHSASPSVLLSLSERAHLVDTSCRNVVHVLEVAKSFTSRNIRVVFIGKADHEEAEMIQSFIPDALVVSTDTDIEKLPVDQPLGLVSQSTQTQEKFLRLAKAIEQSSRVGVEVGMTVCRETHLRQQAAIELAQHVDKIIVIGGRYSSNTAELTNTCRKFALAWQIETAQEIKVDWFTHGDRVGVTAGASTPDIVVEEVVKHLQDIAIKYIDASMQPDSLRKILNQIRWVISRSKTKLLNQALLLIEKVRHIFKINPTGMDT